MNLNIVVNEESVRKEATDKASEAARDIAWRQVSQHFQRPYSNQQPAGFGYLAIQKSVDDMLASPEFSAKMESLVSKYLEQYAYEAAQEAAKRGARKLAQAAHDKLLKEKQDE